MSDLKDTTQVEPTRVSVNVGYKMNLGNYENASVNVGISASALPGEKASDAVDRVFALAEGKLMDKLDEMKKDAEEAGLGQD
jgi:hypothetical protein